MCHGRHCMQHGSWCIGTIDEDSKLKRKEENGSSRSAWALGFHMCLQWLPVGLAPYPYQSCPSYLYLRPSDLAVVTPSATPANAAYAIN
jgi:hypothetical protein